MTPIEIRGAIMFFTGMMPNDFAKSNDIARSTLHRVIKAELSTSSVRQIIAEAICKPVTEIWPDGGHKKVPSSERK